MAGHYRKTIDTQKVADMAVVKNMFRLTTAYGRFSLSGRLVPS